MSHLEVGCQQWVGYARPTCPVVAEMAKLLRTVSPLVILHQTELQTIRNKIHDITIRSSGKTYQAYRW
jgi:hypothetical protein